MIGDRRELVFEKEKKFTMTLSGKPLIIETGVVAQLASGSCFVRYGDTVVSVAVTASSKQREGIDFLPLSVDYEEKLYAVGKIPGSFTKREGRPSEKAIITSRLIDRPIRPMFPKNLRNDVSVVCTVLSVDPDCTPKIAAIIGASCALSISDIPWNGPISGVDIGFVDGKFVLNPNNEQRQNASMSVTVASSKELITMIEANANEVSNEVMLEALMLGHKTNKEVIKFIENIRSQIGKKKFSFEFKKLDNNMFELVREFSEERVEKILLNTKKKEDQTSQILKVREKNLEHFSKEFPEKEEELDRCFYEIQKSIIRKNLLEKNERIDGRKLDEIRPLAAKVSLLPRVHGSALFIRGETQVLTTVTLGSVSNQQLLDGIDEEEAKRYIHHYNFPSYSVGETRPSRGPGRREIGHGALAERALLPVLPSTEKFPYAIRLVSEVLSSNGSTSQGSVCGSTLALMDAGVPIKAPVAGISCGLIKEGKKFVTMVDIQGEEDFFGDMDFKVAGTHKGITAIQVDTKIEGLTTEIVKEALEKTYKARVYILDELMLKIIKKPRIELSKYVPCVFLTKIPKEKIGEIIGAGGKVVQKLTADFDVQISVEQSGTIFVSSKDKKNCIKAVDAINLIAREIKIGEIYKARVVNITEFGAFVELAPSKEALCHISQLDINRTQRVGDVISLGDEIEVKVKKIDNKGRIDVSRKDVLLEKIQNSTN